MVERCEQGAQDDDATHGQQCSGKNDVEAQGKKKKGRKESDTPKEAQVFYPKGIETAMEKRLYRALVPRHIGGSGEDPIFVITIAKMLPSDKVTHPLLREVMDNIGMIPVVKDELVGIAGSKHRGIRAHIRSLLERLLLIPKKAHEEASCEDEMDKEEEMF